MARAEDKRMALRQREQGVVPALTGSDSGKTMSSPTLPRSSGSRPPNISSKTGARYFRNLLMALASGIHQEYIWH
ncbi:hypothetical protein CBM2623_U50014 [Cupriavidus taiwanensis]|nr:hypothetical protein CBM2608_U60006 [Cupriavidus taiwanensis]SPA38449.1 hypothetical protein CBM2623_U50014 [Cupriavidus taiwanensis]